MEIPGKIGNYRILREVPNRGYGQAFEAEQVSIGRRVHLKVLPHPGKQILERFQKEGHLLASLDDPRIVPVHDSGQENGLFYFSQARVPGETLRKWQASWREKVAVIAEVAAAMDRVHLKGIVHRDLNPDCLILSEEGRPRITGFGLCRSNRDGKLSGETRRNFDSPYWSPELSSGCSVIEAETDIYSLGKILAGMVPARAPWEIRTIIEKATATDPENRYRRASEFQGDLERFLTGSPISLSPPTLGMRIRTLAKKKQVLAAASLVVGIFATAYLGLRSEPSHPSTTHPEHWLEVVSTRMQDEFLLNKLLQHKRHLRFPHSPKSAEKRIRFAREHLKDLAEVYRPENKTMNRFASGLKEFFQKD